MAPRTGEQECRLTAKEFLFPTGKEMVEIGEMAVELVGVGVPPGEQCQLTKYAGKEGETAGHHPIDTPQGQCHHHNLHPAPQHRHRVGGLGIDEQQQQQGQQQITQHHPLGCQQSLNGFLLQLEIFFQLIHNRFLFLRRVLSDPTAIRIHDGSPVSTRRRFFSPPRPTTPGAHSPIPHVQDGCHSASCAA